jgi:TatD DNase family protein
MILTGTSICNSEQSAVLAKKYPNVLYSKAGIHPHDAKSFNAQSIPKFLPFVAATWQHLKEYP